MRTVAPRGIWLEIVTSRHPAGRFHDGGPSGENLSDLMKASKSAACRSRARGEYVSPILGGWNLKKYQSSGLSPAGAMAPRMRVVGSPSPGSSESRSRSGGSLGAVYLETPGVGEHPASAARASATVSRRATAGRNGPVIRKRIPGTRDDPAGR